MKKLAIIIGTRPEIIKMAPVVKACDKLKLDYFLVHSNQHYSYNLDKIFFKELGIKKPDYNLNVFSRSHGEQIGFMVSEFKKVIKKEKPFIILAQGDTNTVAAAAIVGKSLGIDFGHVEAGLRSFDNTMPEELNRVMADHLGTFLFAPTALAQKNLLKEGIIRDLVYITGNTIVDSIKIFSKRINKRILEKLRVSPKKYFLLTLHRPGNVGRSYELESIFRGLTFVSEKFNYPIIFPAHPRTITAVKKFGLNLPAGVKVIPPLGYLEFLALEKYARAVFTDSGGIQEETCILQTPCITLRENTERPEAIITGANVIVGLTTENILFSLEKVLKTHKPWLNPFGDGCAGKKIIDIIAKNL